MAGSASDGRESHALICDSAVCLSVCCRRLPVGGRLFEAVLINFQSEQSKFIKRLLALFEDAVHARTRSHPGKHVCINI